MTSTASNNFTSPLNENGKAINTATTNGTHKNKHNHKQKNHHQQQVNDQHLDENNNNNNNNNDVDDDQQENHPQHAQQAQQPKQRQAKASSEGGAKKNTKMDDLLGEDMDAVKQVISYIPFSNTLFNTSVYVYQTVTPQIIQRTVEKEVLPRTNPILNTACEYVIEDVVPHLHKAANFAPAIYTYVVDKTHSTLDYVLPPLSKTKPVDAETQKAAHTLFEIPVIITKRLHERSQQIVEADLRETVGKYLSDFVEKVDTADENGKEVSVYRLLSDMLVILKTTPITSALPKSLSNNLPGKLPTEDISTINACNKLFVDSRDFSMHMASQLMERYQARQAQLAQLVEHAINSMKKGTKSPSASASSATHQ